MSRAHGCSCTRSPRPSCPAHAAWAQASALKEWFGEVADDFPFFPDAQGRTCSKDAVAATLVEAAKTLKAPTETPTGKITGHSMRVTGAQGMAAAGMDLWAIQLLGRWGSMAIKSYVRDAHLEQAEGWARKVAQQMDVDEVTKKMAEQLDANLSGSEIWKALVDKAEVKVKAAAANSAMKAPLEAECVEALAVRALPETQKQVRLDAVVSSSGVAHYVVFGPPEADMSLAVTTCGWRFGGAVGARLAPRSELPAMYKKLCARCFPEEREAGKEAFAAVAKEA